MWFIYAIVIMAVCAFAGRRYGWHLYHRFGRPLFLRRLIGKTRASTPPLQERRLNDYSVLQVYDDGSIISKRIEKPVNLFDFAIARSGYMKFDSTFLSRFIAL